MQLETKKHLEDIRQAAQAILDFTEDKMLDDYTNDEMLHSAVERKFEVIGEALNRLLKINPAVAAQIENYQRIISFRNLLIHGYDVVEDPIVWDVITKNVPLLYKQVQTLLK